VAHLQALAAQLAGRGFAMVTGCCSGADQAVIEAALAGRLPVAALQVMAAFGPDGQGACPVSAVSAVQAFAARGGYVSWWAGGGQGRPLRARLQQRTVAVVGGASFLVAMQPGRGSWRACRLAADQWRQVVVFAPSLQSLGGGKWCSITSAGLWSAGQCWVPHQSSIF
jgi:hypothetical protein